MASNKKVLDIGDVFYVTHKPGTIPDAVGRIFYIPNYYMDSDSEVLAFTRTLLEETHRFSFCTGVHIHNVKSTYIESSRRYLGMRVFWADVNECPAGAYVLGGDLDMFKWIRN